MCHIPDQIECWESVAERHYDEMTTGVPKDHYRIRKPL